MLLTWILKSNNTDWCLELAPERRIENCVKLQPLEMEVEARLWRHFLGRWSVFCAQGSLWSRSFDDRLLGAKATCEVADREQIAEEAERKFCLSENGIMSNNPTRPHFSRDWFLLGHMALAETLLMPQQKARCYWGLRRLPSMDCLRAQNYALQKGGDFCRALRTSFYRLKPSTFGCPIWVFPKLN